MAYMEVLRMPTPPSVRVLTSNGTSRRPSCSVAHYSTSPSGSSPDLTHDTTEDHTPDSDHGDATMSPDSVVPKIEEPDDQHALASSIDAKPIMADVHQLPPQPSMLRKRGRPRKHPIVEQKKTTHVRSKTGCGTCRKRKKKCDETKPSCLNCEKNNVVCDGYEPRQPWRPGKQKALSRRPSIPSELPMYAEGIECDTDRLFFDHFCRRTSKLLSLTDNGKSPFLSIILPRTFEHVGLMHSVLYLSGTLLLTEAPVENLEWQERFKHHSVKAVKRLNDSITDTLKECETAEQSLSSAKFSLNIAQTLMLCLQTVAEGKTDASFRPHLTVMKHMLCLQKGSLPSEELRQFIVEFLLYHDHVDAMTNLKYGADARAAEAMKHLALSKYTTQPLAGSLLGVFDQIFTFISRIQRLRVIIREQRKNGLGHRLQEFEDLQESMNIDKALREWRSSYPDGSPRYTASLLYRLCIWIYLTRTTEMSRPSPSLQQAVDDGLALLRQLPRCGEDESTQSILLMPLFLLGCAAFEPRQRPLIRENFQQLQDWSHLGNIKHARMVVEMIWQKMDQGLENESWDWETLMEKHELDFLIS